MYQNTGFSWRVITTVKGFRNELEMKREILPCLFPIVNWWPCWFSKNASHMKVVQYLHVATCILWPILLIYFLFSYCTVPILFPVCCKTCNQHDQVLSCCLLSTSGSMFVLILIGLFPTTELCHQWKQLLVTLSFWICWISYTDIQGIQEARYHCWGSN